ncbi:unnamed protein product, partial [Mesorhabditis spiculigera]
MPTREAMKLVLGTDCPAIKEEKVNHITKQIGMFSYTGLTAGQLNHLIEKHKVFILKDGRINLCGLNTTNVEGVAKAFDETVRNVKNQI